MHVAKDQRSKLDSKSKPCIFLGYSEDEFGYKTWDLLDKKVIRSRDIIFMEDKTIEDSRQQKPKTSSQSTTIMESALVIPFPHNQSANNSQLMKLNTSQPTHNSKLMHTNLSQMMRW